MGILPAGALEGLPGVELPVGIVLKVPLQAGLVLSKPLEPGESPG